MILDFLEIAKNGLIRLTPYCQESCGAWHRICGLNLVCNGSKLDCVCVCVCAYSSPPCGRRRAGAYINAHDTFLFKRAIFEMILRQVQLCGELLQRFSVRANNV